MLIPKSDSRKETEIKFMTSSYRKVNLSVNHENIHMRQILVRFLNFLIRWSWFKIYTTNKDWIVFHFQDKAGVIGARLVTSSYYFKEIARDFGQNKYSFRIPYQNSRSSLVFLLPVLFLSQEYRRSLVYIGAQIKLSTILRDFLEHKCSLSNLYRLGEIKPDPLDNGT